jgi:hypothetical protein
MIEKKAHGIAMDQMSVAAHADMLGKSLSTAGHAQVFQQAPQPQQQQQPQVPAQSTSNTQNSSSK